MAKTTMIKNADWVVGWNEARQQHEYLQNADVVFKGDEITYVGSHYQGEADEQVSGEGLCVMPGLIDLHAHTFGLGMEKGYVEDAPSGRQGELDWYANIKVIGAAPDDWPTCMEFALSELLKSGVTTVAESCVPFPDLFTVADRSGMRVYFAPMFTSTENDAMWERGPGGSLEYPWAEDGGLSGMQSTIGLLNQLTDNNTHELVKGMVMPAQLETTTPELLQASLEAARKMGTPMQVHGAYSIHEFQEITRRHGTTPIKYMHDIGVLEPDVILAHAIMLDHHSAAREWGTRDDLEILAESGTSIVHCPTYYARRFGSTLEDFGSYREAGVNIGIGTDTYPHNLLEEMRLAVMCGRVISGRTDNITTADIFNAVTSNAAKALHRNDLGRLSPGAKADIVLVDTKHPTMQPVRDPIRSLIFAAAERAVKDVYVNGVKVVDNGEVVTLDYHGTGAQIDGILQNIEEMVPQVDSQQRTTEEIVPLTFDRADSGS